MTLRAKVSNAKDTSELAFVLLDVQRDRRIGKLTDQQARECFQLAARRSYELQREKERQGQ